MTTIQIDEGGHRTTITNIYDEPGGNTNRRLIENQHVINEHRGPQVLAGDFNAHNRAWGGLKTDVRGEELLQWTILNRFNIWNEAMDEPTYQTVNGSSYTDLTLSKGCRIEGWKVDKQETLSGHRYILYEITMTAKTTKNKKIVPDYENTNWNSIRQKLAEQLQAETWETNTKDEVDTKAQKLQDICGALCENYIKRREVTEDHKDWWDTQLTQLRTETRRKRKEAQNEANPERRQEKWEIFKRTRRRYKQEIKEKKDKHIQKQVEEMTHNNP